MLKALDIANYFLNKTDEEAGDLISNLKLQKLLYYSQGFCLAIFDKPLFQEEVEAWTHGPVVPDVYHHFKHYKSDRIPKPCEVKSFDKKTRELLDEVYEVFDQFSAWKLRNMTHDESPWKEAINDSSPIISKESLRTYFRTQIFDDKKKDKAPHKRNRTNVL